MAESIVSATGMRILRLLVGQPPKTLADLVDQTGVTRTAVTEQLSSLLAMGYVDRTIQRTGRGRPHHLYSATEEALQLFPTHTNRFVPALLLALRELGGADLTAQVLGRVSELLATHYRPHLTGATSEARLQQLVALLRTEGVLADATAATGEWVLHERTCPYIAMVGPDREACDIERSMLAALLNTPVEMESCRLDGGCGCAFKLVDLRAQDGTPDVVS